ncbi:MAG: hypothetical protein ABR515_08040, partial [Nitrososphaeraceae archaeon]
VFRRPSLKFIPNFELLVGWKVIFDNLSICGVMPFSIACFRGIMKTITIQTVVNAPMERVWDYWNRPEYIIHWAFASDD